MNKKDVIEFFDHCAPNWDAEMIIDDAVVNVILDNVGVRPGYRVLDVACGTGVLIPDYLARNAASVTAVDISPEMVKIAKQKFPHENVKIICGDVETAQLGMYDCIVVYNAFPHFPEPEKLIRVLASHLAPGGRLTVAHGMSREDINRCHEGRAAKVSMGLLHEDELAAMFEKYLRVTVKISDERMYQVAGVYDEKNN